MQAPTIPLATGEPCFLDRTRTLSFAPAIELTATLRV